MIAAHRLLSKINRFTGYSLVTSANPTVFHVTHWKAGSQWLKALLRAVAPARIVEQKIYETQFHKDKLVQGGIYPGIYVTREQFEAREIPQNSTSFLVIRDLRDTLVSFYFSRKFSHVVMTEEIRRDRHFLQKTSTENGLQYMLETALRSCAEIQESWIGADILTVKYEDLLGDVKPEFCRILDSCGMAVPSRKLSAAIRSCSFEARSNGRPTGSEDVHSHYRKGVQGDWKNYFSDALKNNFKSRYGALLIKTGYEKDMNW